MFVSVGRQEAKKALTWMKAVAIMTPEPKYLHMKKTQFGILMLLDLAAMIGSRAPDMSLASALHGKLSA